MGVKALLDLSRKVAIVTGGSRGIGLQMAEGLGEMGARVAITARKQDELDAARAHLASARDRLPDGRLRPRARRLDSGRRRRGPRALRSDRRPRQQRRLQLGRARRGLPRRRLAQGDDPQSRRAVHLDARGRPPRDDSAEEREDRQHRVDRRALRQSARVGDAHDRLQREQGRGRESDAHARRRMGAVQHQRQCDLPRLLPVEDDEGRRSSGSTARCST